MFKLLVLLSLAAPFMVQAQAGEGNRKYECTIENEGDFLFVDEVLDGYYEYCFDPEGELICKEIVEPCLPIAKDIFNNSPFLKILREEGAIE